MQKGYQVQPDIFAVSGNMIMKINGSTEIQYDFSTSNAVASPDGVIEGLEVGTDTLVVHYGGLTSPAVPILIVDSISVILPLSVSVNAENANCGLENGSISVLAENGAPPYTFTWNTNQTDSVLTNLAAGNYTVSVSDATGLTGVFEIEITNSLPPDVQLDANPVTCLNPTTTIIPNISGGETPFSFEWSTGSVDSILFQVLPGSYEISVTDVNGCTGTAFIEIDDIATATLDFTLDSPTCGEPNGAIVVSAQGGSPITSYSWSNGSNSEQIDNLFPGLYSITATDENGCTIVDSVALEFEPLAEIQILTQHTSCDGTDGQATVIVEGGSPVVAYSWSNGATTPSIDSLPGGTYSVTVTDVNGCEIVASSEILSLTSPFIDLGDDITINQGEQVILDASEPGWTYLWSTGDTTSSIIVETSGTYSVIVTNESGCSASDEIVVTVISSTSEPTKAVFLLVTPNPTSGLITLSCPTQPITSMRIFDSIGRLIVEAGVFLKEGEQREFDLSDLPAGNYLLQVVGEEFVSNVIVVKS